MTTHNEPEARNEHSPEPLLTVEDLSDFLKVPPATLYGYRSKGIGPKGYRFGRHLRYRREEVEAWLDGQAS